MGQEEEGVTWEQSDKSPGSRVRGWSLLHTALKASLKQPMEDPGIFILETCLHLIRTLPVVPVDDTKPEDIDTKAEDHLMDTLGYVLKFIEKTSFVDMMDRSGILAMDPRKLFSGGASGWA